MPMPTSFPAAKTSSPFSSWKGDHTGIRVPDFDAAVAWYTQKLDFRVTHSWPYGDMKFGFIAPAANADFQFEVMGGPGAAPRPLYKDLHGSLGLAGWHHVCFEVDNVDDAIAELKRRGVEVVSEATDNPEIRRRFAFFCDPWGNLFELSQQMKGT